MTNTSCFCLISRFYSELTVLWQEKGKCWICSHITRMVYQGDYEEDTLQVKPHKTLYDIKKDTVVVYFYYKLLRSAQHYQWWTFQGPAQGLEQEVFHKNLLQTTWV